MSFRKASWLGLLLVLVSAAWPAAVQAQYPLHPVYSYARFQVGNGLPIPIVFLPAPQGGVVVPATMMFPTTPATVMQTGVTDPLTLMLAPGVLKAVGPPVLNIPVFLANPKVFQVATDFGLSLPPAPSSVTFAASGRSGPSMATWCPGYGIPTMTHMSPGSTVMSYNPACPAPGVGTPKGLLKYTKTTNQFGGPTKKGGAGKAITAGKANVAFVAAFSPGCPFVGACLAAFNNAYGASPGAIGNNWGVTGMSAPSPVMPGVFPVKVTAMGAVTMLYTPGFGTGPTNKATSFAGPWTTGMLTVSQTAALGGAEIFKRTGSDMRVSGVGGISLISGAISVRTISGPNANRGWITLNIPEPGAAGGAAVALLALAACHALVRRRSR